MICKESEATYAVSTSVGSPSRSQIILIESAGICFSKRVLESHLVTPVTL